MLNSELVYVDWARDYIKEHNGNIWIKGEWDKLYQEQHVALYHMDIQHKLTKEEKELADKEIERWQIKVANDKEIQDLLASKGYCNEYYKLIKKYGCDEDLQRLIALADFEYYEAIGFADTYENDAEPEESGQSFKVIYRASLAEADYYGLLPSWIVKLADGKERFAGVNDIIKGQQN